METIRFAQSLGDPDIRFRIASRRDFLKGLSRRRFFNSRGVPCITFVRPWRCNLLVAMVLIQLTIRFAFGKIDLFVECGFEIWVSFKYYFGLRARKLSVHPNVSFLIEAV